MASEATAATVTSAMAATMTTAMAATTAGVGHLGQREDHGDKHGKHQIEQLTTHETLLLQTVSPVAIDVLG
jgi:hypothetical protein